MILGNSNALNIEATDREFVLSWQNGGSIA